MLKFVTPLAFIMLFNLTHGSPFDSLYLILSCDTLVLTQNQDQDTIHPHSILADLFWTLWVTAQQNIIELQKKRRTLRVHMQ